MDDSKAEVQDTLLEINLGTQDNHWPIYINGRMVPKLRAKMEELLKEFKDCFAFVYTEMLGLSRDLVEHDLPTVEDFKPFKQPPRRMSAEVEFHVKEEIVKLVKAKFNRPNLIFGQAFGAYHAEWSKDEYEQGLDDLDEVRLGALDKLKAQKEAVAQEYDKTTKAKSFGVGDLVWNFSSGTEGSKIWEVVSNLGMSISHPPSTGEGGINFSDQNCRIHDSLINKLFLKKYYPTTGEMAER
ncbi:unnamed protein product [Prunus armeniaca]